MKDILLLTPTTITSGNHSTLSRIQEHLQSFGYTNTQLMCIEDGVKHLKDGEKFDLVLVIHALKCRSVVEYLSAEMKLLLIFGGTDLNVDSLDQRKLAAMSTVVQRADGCIAFSEAMLEKAASLWPESKHKCKLIHQGIKTNPSTEFNFRQHLKAKLRLECKHIALLVAGIRPVKDILFLLEEFAHSEDLANVTLIILGPILDSEYWCLVEKRLRELPQGRVAYAGDLPVDEAHAAIAQSDFLVNSSTSEGMSGAVLEAFQLGTPVIVRENPGNCYLVKHGVNGLVYSTPQAAVNHLTTSMNDSDLTKTMTERARTLVNEKFNYDMERHFYQKFISSL